MAVRLVLTIQANPGKGAELAKAMADRCRDVQKEPGCQQFEVFQSALDPDKLVLLELWEDQQALDVHAEVNRTRAPLDPSLRAEGRPEREDYEYARTS
jgi:quinol monooxygenase YgiN